jgi:hypothetical protein
MTDVENEEDVQNIIKFNNSDESKFDSTAVKNMLLKYIPQFSPDICNIIVDKCISFDLRGRLALKPSKNFKESMFLMCYPKYKYDGYPDGDYESITKTGKTPFIVTDEIFMHRTAIPRFDRRIHESRNSYLRYRFNIVKDDTCPGSLALFNWIKEIDDYFDQKINKDKNADGLVSYTGIDIEKQSTIQSMFNCFNGKTNDETGKKTDEIGRKSFKGLTYQRMIQNARPLKDFLTDEIGRKSFKGLTRQRMIQNVKYFELIKVNFSKDYSKISHVESDLSLSSPVIPINTKLIVHGISEQINANATSISDFEKHFKLGSTCKFGLKLHKFAIQKDAKKCWFYLKCSQIDVM